MTDTPPSDCPSQGAEFDMMSALDWKDGIATLPGSDIRVRHKFAILSALVPDKREKGLGLWKKKKKGGADRDGGGGGVVEQTLSELFWWSVGEARSAAPPLPLPPSPPSRQLISSFRFFLLAVPHD